MYEDYNKLTYKEQRELIKYINDNYKLTTKEINNKIQNILDSKNKEQRKLILSITPLIVLLWNKNSKKIIGSSENIMQDTWLFFEYVSVKKLNNSKVLLSSNDIAKRIQTTIKKRESIIKWNNITKSNTRLLDRRVRNIIKSGISNNKTARQIREELTKTMNLNKGKAKSIAVTETNYYKSESKLQSGRLHQSKGNTIIKTWIYTYMSNEHRPNHIMANGQKVVGIDTKFNVGGKSTIAPQHFGIASEDINCSCDYKIEYMEDVDTSITEYNNYKEEKNG